MKSLRIDVVMSWEYGLIILLIGISLIIIGVLYPYIKKLGLGQLPGDILFKTGNTTFFFPIITCIIISIVLSVIFNLFK